MCLASLRGPSPFSYWNWCMFTWVFCFLMTVVIIVIELLGITLLLKLIQFDWGDFTTGMSILFAIMLLSASVLYAVFYTCSKCVLSLVTTCVSFLCFITYTIEAVMAKMDGGGGYMSTMPGFLKVLESFISCIIFISLTGYYGKPGMEWCIVVYAVCFPVTLLILIYNILPTLCKPCVFPMNKIAPIFSVVAVLLYVSAAILWPLSAFRNYPRPPDCENCLWDSLLVVTIFTFINLALYILDLIFTMCSSVLR
ncbi:myeloid-associated differentiation marker-like protein 2 [Amia ocellicauda]|uniref:myeloid-associated differentiation marker-like protein 2 n=1 Tax=Amia ocellicauda TaxID=2972642 RepID=UPI0034638F9A